MFITYPVKIKRKKNKTSPFSHISFPGIKSTNDVIKKGNDNEQTIQYLPHLTVTTYASQLALLPLSVMTGLPMTMMTLKQICLCCVQSFD